MPTPIFPRSQASGLLIIDIQERLMAAMPEARQAMVIKAHGALIELADHFGVPIACTEQYPKGLGPTVEPIAGALSDRPRVEKTEFSACQNDGFCATVLRELPDDVILTGMETHVCVLQTAVDLVATGRRVFVPLDAVSSRFDAHYTNGLALLERAGAVVTNTETIVFKWLGKAGGDTFKRLSALMK